MNKIQTPLDVLRDLVAFEFSAVRETEGYEAALAQFCRLKRRALAVLAQADGRQS